ncbi:SpoIID/LytB domain-containing protein [Calothrix sp. UHCC 0171]|uniref:SpoIID/LytB domain-containing protein n=1 Tax=Calothrix sp. UHCC 0171 TaxID=3110245 RepID=UPI002B1E9EDD|nr:SpoIID/LytB domain-containing protein [Calothrix sp. UHCC 0171]MEA5569779.1 SpoIID/LytB domain-containing protein [Calothrix sp. UHCC 0171]
MDMILGRLYYTTVTMFCVLGLTGASSTASKTEDVELKIGIVQRFGDDAKEILQLEPTKGDRLRLNFQTRAGERSVTTDKPVRLEIAMQSLAKATAEERLILGVFRTFEAAEDNANKWREKGIEVEIAQPDRWQVWAKRGTYSTPLLRRLLLQSLQATGRTTPFIETQVLKQVPIVTWKVGDKTYTSKSIKITSDKNLVRVNEGKKLDVQGNNNPAKNNTKEAKKDTLNPDKARLFPGELLIQPNAYGTYTLVNQVQLETYLRGVVPYEIGTTAPTSALEAQAIIARTYVLRNLHRFAVDDYQLCADTHCQVYFGLKGVAPTTDKAIAATRGMVLTYDNQLVDALYAASTGGVTASFSDVWNGDERPYLRPVIDSANNIWNLSAKSLADEKNFQAFINKKQGFNESEWQLFRWRRESSLEDIAKDLQKFLKVKKSPYAKFKQVRDMKVVERSISGRILKLEVATDIGSFQLNKDEVRSAFAAPISTLFYLQPINKGQPQLWGYAFVGGGMGHGVGLSQIGAQNLAKLGWSSANILQFYYPNTQLQILNDKIKK